MDHFRECFDRQVAATDELLRNFLTGPAPKEEEMKEKSLATLHHEDVIRLAAERRALARDAYMAERNRLVADLAAANATLDRLREVVPPHGYWPLDDTEHDNITAQTHAILYPPETTP